MWMEKNAQLIFLGLDNISDSEEVIIVEGESDYLALHECGITNVISVPNGATVSTGKHTTNNLAY